MATDKSSEDKVFDALRRDPFQKVLSLWVNMVINGFDDSAFINKLKSMGWTNKEFYEELNSAAEEKKASQKNEKNSINTKIW